MIKLIIGSILLFLGLIAAGIGCFGIFKFKFIMNRMHAAALVDALALSFIVFGLIILSWDLNYLFKLLLILVFQWVGSPIASHMVMRLENETDKEVKNYLRKETHR